MAKTKAKPTKAVLTATEYEAEQSIAPHTRKHADYTREAFTERDCEGGMIEGSRLKRTSPVRALEPLFVKHPKSYEPYLDNIHRLAAFEYDTLLEAAHGKHNHELKESVDSSPNPEGRTLNHIEANDKITRLHLRMPMDYRSMADLLFVKMPTSTMSEIWPNRTLLNINKPIIRDMLDWLAVEFGHKSR